VKRALVPATIAAMLFAMTPAVALADTPSPSPSASASAAADPSPTPTPTPTPTATPTPAPTAAATATPADTPSPTPTPNPTPTATPAPTPTPTPTPSGTTSPGANGGTPTPTPTPTSTATSAPATSTPDAAPTTDAATQQVIDQARQQLGGGMADALSTIQQLSDAMNQNADLQNRLQNQIDTSQSKIDSLNEQIAQLDDQISTTQTDIDSTRAQIGVLARYLYVQPDALLLRLLRAGSVRDMVTQTSDLTAAALRADALERKLSSDLQQQQQDQTDRQNAADQEQQAQDELNQAITELQDLASQEQDSSDQLQSAIDDTQSALDGLDTRGASVVEQVTAMLRQRQEELIATAEHLVWQQAQVWTTLNSSALPPPPATTYGGTQTAPAGTLLAWPIQGATLTQGFGPSTLWLEPAMFGFPHFHTGLDLASSNTRIGAAADGVVAAVGSGTTGYGNYVIIAHGGGIVTLYGHLAVTMVKVGQTVTQGQQIGVEGSTGNSTGVHLHFEVRVNGTPVDPSPYLPARAGA